MTLTNKAGVPYKEGETIESGGVWDEATAHRHLESHAAARPATNVARLLRDRQRKSGLLDEPHRRAVATTTSMNGEVTRRAHRRQRPDLRRPATKPRSKTASKCRAPASKRNPTAPPRRSGIASPTPSKSRCPRTSSPTTRPVIDTLPDSLDFDEYVSATCTSGCPPAIAVHTYKPKVNAAGTTTVAWELGDVEAAERSADGHDRLPRRRARHAPQRRRQSADAHRNQQLRGRLLRQDQQAQLRRSHDSRTHRIRRQKRPG